MGGEVVVHVEVGALGVEDLWGWMVLVFVVCVWEDWWEDWWRGPYGGACGGHCGGVWGCWVGLME